MYRGAASGIGPWEGGDAEVAWSVLSLPRVGPGNVHERVGGGILRFSIVKTEKPCSWLGKKP